MRASDFTLQTLNNLCSFYIMGIQIVSQFNTISAVTLYLGRITAHNDKGSTDSNFNLTRDILIYKDCRRGFEFIRSLFQSEKHSASYYSLAVWLKGKWSSQPVDGMPIQVLLLLRSHWP